MRPLSLSALAWVVLQRLCRLATVLLAASCFGLLTLPAGARPLEEPHLPPLVVEGSIPLGDVRGRIDHLAFDDGRGRLYVAERGNGTVGVIDLAGRRVVARITGFRKPQGIAYEPSTDLIYVADGGDGMLRLYRGADRAPVSEIAVGPDADNVRVDPDAHLVYVGYGDGAIAVLDSANGRKLGDIALAAHPEGFQLAPREPFIYVNLADLHQIAVIDRRTRQQRSTWPLGDLSANFPMVMDDTGQHVITITRAPPALAVFDVRTGGRLATTRVCGDADDAALDARRRRLYVICGEGFVHALAASANGYVPIARVATSRGARTGLLLPRLDLLLVAAPAGAGHEARIWLLRPNDTATNRIPPD